MSAQRAQHPAIKLITALLTGLAVLAITEGCASFALIARGAFVGSPSHVTRYDADLGWVGTPGLELEDAFSPGSHVFRNALGFRSETDTPTERPVGKIRIICSGDSFTFGEGVGNGESWCDLLYAADDRVETVNLAEPGYGVDQSYLRYLRDGEPLEHDVHVFAFIANDFERIRWKALWGYGRPMLQVSDGVLRATNVPVPRLRHWWARALDARDARIFALAGRSARRLSVGATSRQPDMSRDEAEQVTAAILTELMQATSRTGAPAVFVYLPTEDDLGREETWRAWIRAATDTLGADFVDLTEDLRTMFAHQAHALFLRGRWEGHYTEEGNAWVAGLLEQYLPQIPAVRDVMEPSDPEAGAR